MRIGQLATAPANLLGDPRYAVLCGILAFAFAFAFACVCAPVRAASVQADAIDDTQRTELPGLVNRAIRASEDLGAADRRERAERVLLVLQSSPAQRTGLDTLLRDQHRRGQRDFHRWLTPRSFARRFGLAPAQLHWLQQWLAAKGLHVDAVPAGGRTLAFSGTLGQIDDAFATHFHRYRWRGELHVGNSTNPTVPVALAGMIAGFASLSDFRREPQLVRGSARPQYTTGGSNYLAPADFATIYDLQSVYTAGITGAGIHIAVLGRSDVVSTDLSNFRAAFGLSATLPTTIVNGTDPGLVSNDETESDLDLEWAGGIAPAADLVFVTSKSTGLTDGIDLSAEYAVSNNIADIITLSYGSCESTSDVSGGTTLYNSLWQQAAAQGTSVFVASGDSGAADCDVPTETKAVHGLAVNALCTSPDSTCVGGTEFSADETDPSAYWSASNTPGTQASALGYIGEAVWNQSGGNLYASGGGASIYFAKPTWQLATGVPSDARRDVPDLALNASSDHDGYLIYSSDGYSSSTLLEVGGTSAPTPSMAGIAALVAEHEGGRVGAFNPVLYALSNAQAAATGANVFHRITSGNNSVPGQTGFSASPSDSEYSQASGLGSLDGAQLIASWGGASVTSNGLVPTTAFVAASAALGSLTLTLPPSTAWTASVGGGGWLSVTPVSGKGSTILTFAASANRSTASRSASITIDGQVLTVTQAAASAANGDSAVLGLSAATLSFGSDPIGTATATQQLLIGDTGNASLTLGAITLGGVDAADFVDSGSCASGVVLVPGAECYFDIGAVAQATGALSANLQIDIDGGSATSVALAATGVAATQSDTDGPLPLWADGVLGALLVGIAGRRRRVAAGSRPSDDRCE
jgi:hypothetical protein